MRKKLYTLAFIAVLAISLSLQMIPHVYAEHSPSVYWSKTKNDTLSVPGIYWPEWLNFTVENRDITPDADPIVKFKFVIQKNATGYALFHYNQSLHQLAGWSAIPDEFDPSGWPTVIIFEGPAGGIPETEKGWFAVEFVLGPGVCNYKFAVYTVDSGSPPVTKLSWLYLVIDNVKPKVEITAPAPDGAKVIAIWDPYPVKHFMWINITASDNKDALHDTGISRVEIYIDKVLWKTIPVGKPVATISEKRYGLDLGVHSVTAVAFDGVGNSNSVKHTFTYEVVKLFLITPIKGTVGRYNTYDKVTGEWSGSISDVYGKKQLGTRVTAKGLEPPAPLTGFTPNTWVSIYVDHPLHDGDMLVRKVRTDSRGRFETSFLFPTASSGIYKVRAVDAKGITDYAFFTVVSEIIYKPEIVSGPAMIEAIASGLTSDGDVDRFMVNNTDALLSVNMHTVDFWGSDDFGVLRTEMAHKQGILLPLLENGMYNITLHIVDGLYWNGEIGAWSSRDMDIWNKVYVANDFAALLDAMDKLEMKMSDIEPIIESIDGNVVQIKTEVGNIEAKLEDIKPVIESIDGNVVDIHTTVGNIEVKLEDIEPVVESIDGNVVDIHTTVGNIKGTVTSIEGDVATIETDVGVVKLKADDILEELPEPAPDVTLSINLATVLSAIAAIASITAVAVVLRRLRVAA